MLTITNTPEFTHTVHVMTPIDGGHREDTFKARFRMLEDDPDVDFFNVDSVKGHLRRLVVLMEDLVDEQGQQIPYSDDVRDRMLSLPHVRIALLRTYRDALAKERVGN